MIFQMHTCTLKSRSVAEVEARFQRALADRVRLSPLGGFWRTEVGVLNQIMALWPYADEADRARVQAGLKAIPGWLPDIREFILDENETVFTAAPFSPPIEPRRLGGLYEIRTYTYAPEKIPEVIDAWTELLPERLKYSPLVAAGYSQRGSVSLWVHIWAYPNVAERERVRVAVAKAGIWPISVVDQRLKREPRAVSLRMQNTLVVPAPFSPLC